ncbi:MAG: serine/threonine protein kinase [Anaerolineaceae bacterium]|nr:serine/threonine protein kinase [Anaerolineaceae bacterium]
MVRYGQVNPNAAGESRSNAVVPVNTEGNNNYKKSLDLFYREAQALGKLEKQPNVVHAYHVFRDNDTAYIVMEYLEGRSLKSIINERGRIPEEELLPLLEPVLKALDKVHSEGILHRDIAPDNIMVTSDGPVLVDFGAARLEDSRKSSLLIGKKGYSSPEQMAGGYQDARSDIYAMGATFYKALSGVTPQDSAMRGLVKDDLVPLDVLVPGISRRTGSAVAKAMALSLDERWHSAAEFRAALGFTDREENEQIYRNALQKMKNGTPGEYQDAARLFRTIPEWKNSSVLAEECEQKTAALQAAGTGQTEMTGETARTAAYFPLKKLKFPGLILAAAVILCAVLFLIPGIGTKTKKPAATPTAVFPEEPRELFPEGTAAVFVYETETRQAEELAVPDETETRQAAGTAVPDETETRQPEPDETPLPPTATTEPIVPIGTMITFGHYEQDNVPGSGPEPIEWQVLAADENKALLISRYALDAKPYNEGQRDVTWETSTLRSWLNGEFLQSAFSAPEQSRIAAVTNKNPSQAGADGGRDTEDRVFLLSTDEIKLYFPDNKAMTCSATAYAKAHGAYADENDGNTWWWLRSQGVGNTFAYSVNTGEGIYHDFADKTDQAVRPVLWLDLSENGEEGTDDDPIIEPDLSWTPRPGDPGTGDIIRMGYYQQDDMDGEEKIEWQVLAVENGRALVLSRYSLEGRPYEEEKQEATWETSTLRQWLNGDFYNSAFSSEEKALILKVKNSSPDNADFWTAGGNDTEDRIFLLTSDEITGYFDEKYTRICGGTYHAEQNGAGNWFWLRVPGSSGNRAAFVDAGGDIGSRGNKISSPGGVRPAFWLDLTGEETESLVVPTSGPEPLEMPLSSEPEAGDILIFGSYEQDETAGTDPVEWQVLTVINGRALLITRYGLDAMPYNEESAEVTWETSTLRKWLNETFYQRAFNAEEQQQIITVTNENRYNPTEGWPSGGNDTEDRIFLLSSAEAKRYFRDDRARKCYATAYAVTRGAGTDNPLGTSSWWLRSPGSMLTLSSEVENSGYISTSRVDAGSNVVRPAFWLDLSGKQ